MKFEFFKKLIFIINTYKIKILFFFLLLLFINILEILSLTLLTPLILSYINNDSENYFSLINFFPNIFKFDNLLIIKLFILGYSLKFFFMVFAYFYQSKIIFDFKFYISEKLFNHYLYKNLSFFHNNNISKIMRDVNGEVNYFTNNLVVSLLNVISETILLAIIFIVMLRQDYDLTLNLILFSGFSVFIFYYFSKKFIISQSQLRIKFDNFRIKLINEVFSFLKEIKIFNLEDKFKNEFRIINTTKYNSERKIFFLSSLPRIYLESLLFIGIGIILFFNLGSAYESSKDTIPTIVVFSILGVRCLPSTSRIIVNLSNINYGKPILNNLFEILSNLRKSTESNKKIDFKNLLLNDVKFGYHKNHIVLKDINLKISSGDKIAILGESGSGKTTIMHLLIGFFDPIDGQILVNDKLILSENLNSWHKSISYVSQNTFLMDDTILNNIIISNPNKPINFEKIWKLIDILNLGELIDSLPNKLNEHIGQNGVKLSGGQRQRISIARALYSDRNIIFFDEATNSLDKSTSNQIINSIMKNKDITVIFISHDKESIKNCNKIYEITNQKLKSVLLN